MKKLAFLTASVVSALFASQAFAVSGNTITFQGEVTTDTCSVTINGSDAKPVVLLPTVSVDALKVGGATTGNTTFELDVTGCSAKDDSTIYAEFIGNNVSTNGNLKNMATTNPAGKVEIRIIKADESAFNFSTKQTDKLTPLKSGATNATYTAQYYADGQATAGAVEATLQYAISYN